uniref:Checkpoint protein n=1 Tax=Arcella intermedia TaxID=1963864 RepID=A0A6B2LCN0_9EUKA
MTPSSLDSQSVVQFVFLAKSDNAKVISRIVSTLYNTDKNEVVHITVTEAGMKFTVEPKTQLFQGNTFLPADLFQEFHFKKQRDPDDVKEEKPREELCIPLFVFLYCLKIYGDQSTSTGVQIAYRGHGTPLLLLLEENDVTTDCGIRTVDFVKRPLKFDASRKNKVVRIVMQSENLKEALNELDWNNDYLTWHISSDPPLFRLRTKGTGTTCFVDYPTDSEIFEEFECDEATTRHYSMKYIKPCLRALSLAKKTQIMITNVGLLFLQHLIQTDDAPITFVDFYIPPKELNEDE